MSRRATRARSRLTDGEDVDAPGTDPGLPVLAPASPQQETSCANRERADGEPPHSETREARVDTPRPAAKAQGAIYRDENGILRTASAARARALDMPPPAPRTEMVYRHGIAVTDGNREGKRTPKIAEENVARFIDVLRWWASVNDQAQVVRRVPWKEIYEFICVRKAWRTPAPMNSEQLKERVKTVAASVGKRCEMNSETPMELVALFGGPVAEAPEWAGEFSWMEFPLPRLATPKKQSRVRVAASYEVRVEDECVVEFGSPGLASPPRPRETTQVRPTPAPRAPPTPTPAPRMATRAPVQKNANASKEREEEVREDFETIRKRERAAAARGDAEGAAEARLKRLSLTKSVVGVELGMDSAKVIEALANHPPRWPVSAQWLQKRDVGSISHALRHVAKWVWHTPKEIAAATELVERIIGGFAIARALAPKLMFEGETREGIIKKLALHCERATFVPLVKFIDKLAREVEARKPANRRRGTIEEEKARKHRLAARQMVNPQGISIAAKLLESEGVAPANARTLQELRKLCPSARAPIDEPISADIEEYFENGEGAFVAIDTTAVRTAIKSAPKGRTKDVEGVRFEHLQGIVKFANKETLGALTLIIETMARHPRAAFKTIAKARMVGIPKKETQIRPIGITSVFRRVWGKVVLADVGKAASKYLMQSNPQAAQLAVGVRGGTQTAGIIIHALRDANAGHATLQLDVKNAFNELDRNAMLCAARRFGPSLYGFAAALYGNGKQDLAYFLDGADVETIECETGVTQGCGLGTLLFALAFHERIIAELEADQAKELPDREFKDIMICAYADDAAITGPSTQILAFAERLAQRLEKEAALTVKEHIFHPPQNVERQTKLYGEEGNLAGRLSGFRIATEGIVFAGNPIGSIEFVNNEVGKIVAKHAKRLAAIKEFANSSSIDASASPFKGFYRHLALALIQYTCDRRLDYALHVTPTSWIDTEHLVSAQRDIREAIAHACGGEVVYDKLDDVGKTLFKAPFRLGGQSFHDLVEEADLCFVGNVAAHAPLAAKVLVSHDANILESLQLASKREEGRMTWSKCVIEALDDVKSMKLECVDAAGAVPESLSDIFSQDNLNGKTKKQILDLINEDKMERLQEKLSHSRDAVDQVRARSIECLQLSRSRWRGIEALQSALDFHSSHVTEDQEGIQNMNSHSRMGTNLINDAALPIVMRLCLSQPILAGNDASDFSVAERMGWQALWDNKRTGYWSTRRRHDDVMKLIGACIKKTAGVTKACVFEKDAEFARSCFRVGGKVHRPDMVCDNLFDDNIKYVFDLTNASCITRTGCFVVPRENQLEEAENKKRNSEAWKNFMPSDGMVTEFVPIVIGWFGEFGPAFHGFIDRVGSHFGDRSGSEKESSFAAKWRSRRFAASVAVRHLNLIGVYLNAKKKVMEDLDVQERETEVDEFWMFVRRRVACLEMAFQNIRVTLMDRYYLRYNNLRK
eukprot:CAMPEP_0179605500 /NCGR_PEP_ID=MMETSP0930-20121108/946_1 /TAXON_ID=548131 ORGANISM="Ostreococcus mediterraneus, Strain clade-D-RCC1621" /NCGR_SAMPLE_ID=MMETSP0930 /ASSEMBLY_ACC=CAM_ASM_000580 /LENGTH=1456 /DNA_ID=CAMNT_0021473917 /DNA_START=3513 /DNA_END=7884 /DNA_ORIENTATION=-